MKFSIYILLILVLSGCSVGPPYDPPEVEVPSTWKNDSDCLACSSNDLVYLDFWWQVFEDETLDDLELLALENNRDLLAAYERIKEAQASMWIAASYFYPQLSFNPQYTNTSELEKVYAPLPPGQVFNADRIFRAHELYYFLPFVLNYEVDLWGKIEDRYFSARYQWEAQQKDYESIMLTLTSNLATAYFQMRAIDAEIQVTKQVLSTRQKAYEIQKLRYEGNIIFYADVTLAAEEVDTALVQIKELVRQRKVLENQIATLIGTPASEFCLAENPLIGEPPCIPAGLPSEMLLRRPDLAESLFLTQSAHANVKEAYALFFPSLVITETAGFESPILKTFLSWISRYFQTNIQMGQSIFDGFRNESNLKLQIAHFLELSREYQQLVLTAFQDVEDALSNIRIYAEKYATTKNTVEWAQKTYQLYSDRYTSGLDNYINVVNTERDLLNYQLNLNQSLGYRYISTIQLIKSLGGGWD